MATAILSGDELQEITGYKQPTKQLAMLHKRGFWRALISGTGRVILERAHYEAVCSGAANASQTNTRPKLRLAKG